MTDIDGIQSEFSKRLDTHRDEHSARVEKDLKDLRAYLSSRTSSSGPVNLERRAKQIATRWSSPAPSSVPSRALVDITRDKGLAELDDQFIQDFDLSKYYPVANIKYPTKFCETLAEFFGPKLQLMDWSKEFREQALDQEVNMAVETWEKERGGTWGYVIPGNGAYVNGWLIEQYRKILPAERSADAQKKLINTAVHEKLGHGFLAAYSALGKVNSRLEVIKAETAARFGLRTSDDPVSTLRFQQSNLLLSHSLLMEEGWATWLENTFPSGDARHSFAQVVEAIETLPLDLSNRTNIKEQLLIALCILFSDDPIDPDVLHKAVRTAQQVPNNVDQHFLFNSPLGQPFRYAVGELLAVQTERNLGRKSVPYATLIAANVTLDPKSVGLTDLAALLELDPRLDADVRFAAVSRLKPEAQDRNNVALLARQASAELNLAIPKELQ